MSVDDLIIELRFFVPSKTLTETILSLNGLFLKAVEASGSVKPLRVDLRRGFILTFWHRRQIRRHQRIIAERLYRHLASIARNQDLRGQAVSIWDCIPQGMSTALGFPSYRDLNIHSELGPHAFNALKDLTIEFREWLLEKPEGYQAPWGQVMLIDGDHLVLQPITEWCGTPSTDHAPTPNLDGPMADRRELVGS